MFDIAKLDTRSASEAGVPMKILHPKTSAPMLDDQGQPVTITLLGPNSEKSKALNREQQLRRADMSSRGVKMNDADYERERFDLLVGITVGWSMDTIDGAPFPFNPDNCARLWSDNRWSWLSAQAWLFAMQDGNYLPS